MIKWHGRLRNGGTSIKDDERCGRLSSLRPTFETKIQEMLDVDIDDLQLRLFLKIWIFPLMHSYKILTEHAHA